MRFILFIAMFNLLIPWSAPAVTAFDQFQDQVLGDESQDTPYDFDVEHFAMKVPIFRPTVSPTDILEEISKSAQDSLRGRVDLLDWDTVPRDPKLPNPKKVPPYNREKQYGPWMPDPSGKTCFNTRGLVLVRESKDEVVVIKDQPCFIESGKWKDPYTARTFKMAADIEVDHMVPLKQNYLSSGWRWKSQIRCNYANFMGNNFHLIPVSKVENRLKSDQTPASYLPPNEKYHCTYVQNWLQIKAIWGLILSTREGEGIKKIIDEEGCKIQGYSLSELRRQRKLATTTSEACDDFAHGRLPPHPLEPIEP